MSRSIERINNRVSFTGKTATFYFVTTPASHSAKYFSQCSTILYYRNLQCLDAFRFCVKSLWPGDDIWPCRSGSTLAQVMACCLTAPTHVKASWLWKPGCFLMKWAPAELTLTYHLRHSPQSNFTRSAQDMNPSWFWKLHYSNNSNIPRGQGVNPFTYQQWNETIRDI